MSYSNPCTHRARARVPIATTFDPLPHARTYDSCCTRCCRSFLRGTYASILLVLNILDIVLGCGLVIFSVWLTTRGAELLLYLPLLLVGSIQMVVSISSLYGLWSPFSCMLGCSSALAILAGLSDIAFAILLLTTSDEVEKRLRELARGSDDLTEDQVEQVMEWHEYISYCLFGMAFLEGVRFYIAKKYNASHSQLRHEEYQRVEHEESEFRREQTVKRDALKEKYSNLRSKYKDKFSGAGNSSSNDGDDVWA